MANAVYPKFKQRLIAAASLTNTTAVDMSSNTIKIALIDTGTYTYSSTHEFYSSASSAAVGTPQTLASKTFTNGVFDAADATFSALTGNSVEALIVYKDTGNTATSPLIAYLDTSVTNLPITPDGGGVVVQFSASGIFSL